MNGYGRAMLILLSLAAVLFLASYAMLIISGVSPSVAFVWNKLSALDVGFDVLPQALLPQPLVLLANLLDAFIFALLTVVLAAAFFGFIRRINISRRFMLSKIRHLKQHIIIVPYNNFSNSIARELRTSGEKIVMVTDKEEEARRLYRRGELVIVADPKNIETFHVAGINTAKYVIACSDDDIQNALISITAKSANPRAKIVSRVCDLDNIARIRQAGAYRMIMPEVVSGTEIGDIIIKKLAQ